MPVFRVGEVLSFSAIQVHNIRCGLDFCRRKPRDSRVVFFYKKRWAEKSAHRLEL